MTIEEIICILAAIWFTTAFVFGFYHVSLYNKVDRLQLELEAFIRAYMNLNKLDPTLWPFPSKFDFICPNCKTTFKNRTLDSGLAIVEFSPK